MSLLINMKMPTIDGILIIISTETFMLSWVEHEKVLYPRGLVSIKYMTKLENH